MRIWEFSILELNFTSFYLPEIGATDSFLQIIEDIGGNVISDKWKSFVLLKDEQAIDPDFFTILETGETIVSSAGAALLSIMMEEKDYELLPFLNDEDEYYLFNLLKSVDCLNKEKSIIDTLPNGQIVEYENLIFISDQIEDTPIFKVPELPHNIFVTHAFQYLYNELELKGLDFSSDNLVFVD